MFSHDFLIFALIHFCVGNDFGTVWKDSWREEEIFACLEDWGKEGWHGQRAQVHATTFKQEEQWWHLYQTGKITTIMYLFYIFASVLTW